MDDGDAPVNSERPLSPFVFILKLGLLVGLLDILAAFASVYLWYGSNPLSVLRFIASGVFGRAALSGGLPMAIWGCVFHFMIATTWTLLFFTIYPKVSLLSKNRIVSGVLFGILIWLVMNLVVLPLSGTPKMRLNLLRSMEGMAILIVMIGIPVSSHVHKYYSRKRGI